jgi:hypothetical protein
MTSLALENEKPQRSFVAGWAVSLTLHAALFLIVGMTLRGCQHGSAGQAGGEVFRDVGLFVVDGVDDGQAAAGLAPGADVTQPVSEQQPEESTSENLMPDHQQNRVPTEAPDFASLLNQNPFDANSHADGASDSALPPLIGPGQAIGGGRTQSSSAPSSLIKPFEAGGAARIGGMGGPGQTTFMDISGVGKMFVYVIDTSSSMTGSRLKVAQGQLKASLRLLQPNQKFAVIFFNEYRERLKLRRNDDRPIYFATDVNKELAGHQIDRVTADRGTVPMPAILEAISLKPDVIYFLTDGDESELSPAEMAQVRQLSRNITIHVIKLGDGTLSSLRPSWLKRLADQAHGEYREINIGNR